MDAGPGVDVCHFRNGREDRQVGVGGNRAGWRERQKLGHGGPESHMEWMKLWPEDN